MCYHAEEKALILSDHSVLLLCKKMKDWRKQRSDPKSKGVFLWTALDRGMAGIGAGSLQ